MNWHEATVIHWFHLVPGTQGGSQALNHPRGSGQLQANSASGLILQLYLPPHLVLSMSRSCFSSAAKRLKQAEEPKQGFGVAQAWIWRLTTLLASSGPESRFAQPPWACCDGEDAGPLLRESRHAASQFRSTPEPTEQPLLYALLYPCPPVSSWLSLASGVLVNV